MTWSIAMAMEALKGGANHNIARRETYRWGDLAVVIAESFLAVWHA